MRLRSLGYRLREYVPARSIQDVKIVGNIAYVSGQGPHQPDGKLQYVGKVGRELTVEQGYEAAARVAVNCLSVLKTALGDLGRVEEIIKVLGFVNCVPSFTQHPQVMNGFTDLLLKVMGPAGRHARSAIGACSLPNDQAVEVEMIVMVRTAGG